MKSNNMPKIIELLTQVEAHSLREEINSHCHKLWSEYFSFEKYEDFLSKYFFGDSPVSRALAYRVMTKARYDQFGKKILREVQKNQFTVDGELVRDVICHPIFYIRKLTPAVYKTQSEQNCLFESQPHFDRTYNEYAYTVWISITKSNRETGGVCWFEDTKNELAKYKSPWGEKNVLGHFNYMKQFHEIDQDFRPFLRSAELQPGEALFFDSNILHAGTKPTSNQERMSFDMRFVPITDTKTAELLDKKVVGFNDNIDLWSALNLLSLGDVAGAKEKIPDIMSKSAEYFDSNQQENSFASPFEKVHWSTEYAWLN